MSLIKIHDYNPNYKDDIFRGSDIKGYSIYGNLDQDKVGSVYDILVDESGFLRYLVIDTGLWIFGKKVLLPIGRCRIDYANRRVYATDLTREQVESLPEYNDDLTVDYNYEERVRNAYRRPGVQAAAYTSNSYNYEHEPELYGVRQKDHDTIKLYEERLIANKTREKTGEVTIGKRVETEQATASVPVQKERVIVERNNPTNPDQPVTPGEVAFREGEVARVAVYEETADIHKQAFVREEVTVRKEIEQDQVTAKETLRREELDVDVDGKPIINDSTLNR
ncbi:DUF2382 domain-containing protein [Gloeothece verrucosa]|uniref:PRC-barrel domain protein n=1 Tax=Gloeothece verrucosa (strain PCC 7822) TaxID=497965 RepID=E0U917_GLOV7|nr:DUF2382 domain-containing protein [Gloeothece verrucosa]ADN16156.1 Domain of unknown function DUF2382-like protein [Gloeothece verrucosa PCC 7822]